MTYSQLTFTEPDDLLFSIQSEGREIKCRVAEEWMYQQYGFRAGADMIFHRTRK